MSITKQFFRFVIAGGIVNAGDFAIYFLLFHVLPVSVAKGISFTCAAIAGYLLSKYWIFRNHQASLDEALRYAIINILALGIDVFINKSMLNAYPGHPVWAVIVATASTGLFTFFSFKFWVFSRT